MNINKYRKKQIKQDYLFLKEFHHGSESIALAKQSTGLAKQSAGSAKKPQGLKFTSNLVTADGMISDEHIKDISNITPNVSITTGSIPLNTKQIILLMYDPDAKEKTFIHWFISLNQNNKFDLSQGVVMKNDFNNNEYDGPRPPKGTGTHVYHLAIYALNEMIEFDPNETYGYNRIMGMIENNIIEKSEIIGSYSNDK